MKKATSSPPAKSAAASTSRPRRRSGKESRPFPGAEEAGADQQQLVKKIMTIFGPSGTVNRNFDFMRDLVGEAWEDYLTDVVFQALFVKKKRRHAKPTEDNLGKEAVEWLPQDFLFGWINDALKSKDAAFFLRLGKSIEALNKVWPDGIMEAMKPDDKWIWAGARFVKTFWDKHGCAPTQQAVREHLESMEDYHGKASIQTVKPLPMTGSFKHVDRTPGRPRKNPPGKSSGAV